MILICKQFKFAAAHRLPGHKGACRRLHGHQWVVEVGVSGPIDSDTGMIADFSNLKSLVNDSIIDRLDHYYLNEVDQLGFPADNPTAENMVSWMRDVLTSKLYRTTDCQVEFIRLWESDTAYAEWRKD